MHELRRGRLLALSEDSVLVRKNGTEKAIGGHATPIRDHRGHVNTQSHFVCRIVYTPTGDKSPVYKTAPDSSG
jgi:hypothetical protein